MADPALDLRQFDELVADLGKIPGRLAPQVAATVKKGAQNIKDDWADRWSDLDSAPRLDAAISYSLAGGGYGVFAAEIGPDKDRPQGALGNLVEYGSVNNAPIPGGAPALDAEEPRFTKAIAGAAADAVIGRR